MTRPRYEECARIDSDGFTHQVCSGWWLILLNYLKVKYLFSYGFIASIDGTARSIDMSLFIQHFISISILLNVKYYLFEVIIFVLTTIRLLKLRVELES